ncbi:hypothetical protein GF312_02220 [Candidatus Poribacteria bacterium]|nr:hypothetical protein [Candidatus Poribacteria bacterium]
MPGNGKPDGKSIKLPERFQLHGVPHNPVKQKGTDCAPDSLRMVLNYRGKDISKDWDIPMQLSGIRGRSGGTTLRQMQDIAANYYGLPSFLIQNCDLKSIKASIINKWPPIIGYRSRGSLYHAVVVVGYDDKRNNVLVNDPNYLRTRKIRYYDLGGVSGDSVQRFEALFVLPEGSTLDTFKHGLRKYVPEKTVAKLRIFTMPSEK